MRGFGLPERSHAPIPVAGVDHIAIAVPDLDAAERLLASRFGISLGEAKDVPAQDVRIAYADLGNIKLELVAPLSADSSVAGFLAKRPLGGLHHICFSVPNAREAHAEAVAQDLSTTGPPRPGHHGRDLFFLSPKDTLGALVEIESRE